MAFELTTVGNTALTTSGEETPKLNQLARTFADMARAHPDWMSDPLMGAVPVDYLENGDRKNYYVGEGRLNVGDRYSRIDAAMPIQPAEIGEKTITGIASRWQRSISIPRSRDLISSYNSLEMQLNSLMGVARRQRMAKLLRVLGATPVAGVTSGAENPTSIIVDVDSGWQWQQDANGTGMENKANTAQDLNLTMLSRGYAGLEAASALQEGEQVFPICSYAQWQKLRNDPLANHADRNRDHAAYLSSNASLENFNPLNDFGEKILYRNFASGDGVPFAAGASTQNAWLIGKSAVQCLIPSKVPYINEYAAGSVDNMPGTILEMYELPEKDIFVAVVHCYEGFVVSFPNAVARLTTKVPA